MTRDQKFEHEYRQMILALSIKEGQRIAPCVLSVLGVEYDLFRVKLYTDSFLSN